MYHRVADVPVDPQLLCVGPERFAEHLQWLRRNVELVPLSGVLGRGSRRVAITFDDGYADNELVARPLLEAAEIPATVFVTAGMVDSPEEFWWDELERLWFGSVHLNHLEILLAGRRLWVDVRSAAGRQRAYWGLYARMRDLPPEEIRGIMKDLRAQLNQQAGGRPTHRTLTSPELRQLSSSRLVEIGAHTITHPSLRHLPTEAQRTEIAGSRDMLEDLGCRVRAFAYPFGGPSALDDITTRLVDEAGFDIACVTTDGAVSALSHRLRIPRFTVRDWSAERLGAELHLRFRD